MENERTYFRVFFLSNSSTSELISSKWWSDFSDLLIDAVYEDENRDLALFHQDIGCYSTDLINDFVNAAPFS